MSCCKGEQLHAEVAGLIADVEAVEGERDAAAAEHSQVRKALSAAETEVHKLAETIKLRETTVEELREQVGKLEATNTSLLDRLIATVDRLSASSAETQ